MSAIESPSVAAKKSAAFTVASPPFLKNSRTRLDSFPRPLQMRNATPQELICCVMGSLSRSTFSSSAAWSPEHRNIVTLVSSSFAKGFSFIICLAKQFRYRCKIFAVILYSIRPNNFLLIGLALFKELRKTRSCRQRCSFVKCRHSVANFDFPGILRDFLVRHGWLTFSTRAWFNRKRQNGLKVSMQPITKNRCDSVYLWYQTLLGRTNSVERSADATWTPRKTNA